jgi:hypothetical protein
MIVMLQLVPAQNAACSAEFAKLPALSTPMSFVVLSEARET